MTNRNRHDPQSSLGGAKARSYAQVSFRDRPVACKIVVCPTCNAQVDELCVSSTGKVTTHASRRRMALRAASDNYSVADCEYATHLGPKVRRAVREAMKVSISQLAITLHVERYHILRWEAEWTTVAGPGGARYGIWLRENYAQAQVRIEEFRARIAAGLESELEEDDPDGG